jgi:flavin reductase (DIM6/NTAB) family NADH-FMN oxidoreductase RutF
MHAEIGRAFRAVMRETTSPVSIITTCDDGAPRGLVATSVISASMDPPTILYCVNKGSSFHPMVERGRRFCVNFLSSEDVGIAEHFGATKGAERFALGEWSMEGRPVPWLRSAQASIFGEIQHIVDWHTHSVVYGCVVETVLQAGARPLLYSQGAFAKATVAGDEAASRLA